MAKIKRTDDWYRELIKKIGTETIDGKKFWQLVEETNLDFSLPKLPLGSKHIIVEKLQKTGLVDVVKDEKGSFLVSITNVDAALKAIEIKTKPGPKPKPKATKEKPKKVEKKVEVVEVAPKAVTPEAKERESFIKYFRCLRCAARSRKRVLDLKTCMDVNKLTRIAGFHVEAWYKTVKNLGVEITAPIVKKSESGEITIEFNNYEEDLYKVCLVGQELYPDYRSTIPAEAFGTEVYARQVQQRIEKKAEIKKEQETKKVLGAPKPPIGSEEQKRLIFMTAGKLFEEGYQTLTQIKEYLDQKGFNLTKAQIKDILGTCPEINGLKDPSEEIYLRSLMRGETDKQFWDSIRNTYGIKNTEKEEILCRISMTKGEVSEYLSKTTEISVVSRISEHDNIFRITVAKHSIVDKMNLVSLVRRFRREDVMLTRSDYTEELYKMMKEEERRLRMSNDLYRYETGFFQK